VPSITLFTYKKLSECQSVTFDRNRNSPIKITTIVHRKSVKMASFAYTVEVAKRSSADVAPTFVSRTLTGQRPHFLFQADLIPYHFLIPMEGLPPDRDFLALLSPIFKLPEVQIYWYDQVQEIGQRNDLDPRIFVVASLGIFLIQRKSFPFPSRIVRAISFCDLVSENVTQDSVSFSSTKEQIRFRHDRIPEIAFLVYFIRQAQIPTDILPINASFPDSMTSVKLDQSPYHPTSLFFDRLLSCALHCNLMVTHALLSQVQMPASKVFDITPELLSSPLFPALLLSLTYEQDVTHLRMRGFALSQFFAQCEQLFRYNRFIQTLTFDRIDFGDGAKMKSQWFEKPHAFKPSEWIFVNCDITKKAFARFFESIGSIGRPISSLEFRNCTIDEQIFRSVFQAIFFNDCFHSLQSFAIEGIRLSELTDCVFQLTCCRWAMQSKCLKRISLVDCGIDGPAFLAQFLQFDVGLREINLTGCDFSKPLPSIQTVAVRDLTYLGIRSGTTSLLFVMSLFDLFRQHSISVTALDLSELPLPPDDFTTFLQRLSGETVRGLRFLMFDGNRMNSAQTLSFVQFLQRHPALTSLSINCSVDVSDRPAGLTALMNVLSNRAMVALSWRGDSSIKFSFGPLLLPLLNSDALLSIRYLDITNQSIGDRGLEAISRLLDHDTITELDFDGSSATNLDTLCKFCERIIDSHLRFVGFPAADFEKFERLVDLKWPNGQINECKDRMLRLFNAKFERPLEGLERARLVIEVMQRMGGGQVKAQPNATDRKMRRSESDLSVLTDWEEVSRIAPELQAKYKECVGEVEGSPVVQILAEVAAGLTLEALLSEVE
jgi:hypothetical protein